MPTLADGIDFQVGDILSSQQMTRIKNNWWETSEPSSIQSGMLYVNSLTEKITLRGISTSEEVLQKVRSRNLDPEFREPIFRGLNIVCFEGSVVTFGNKVVFTGYY